MSLLADEGRRRNHMNQEMGEAEPERDGEIKEILWFLVHILVFVLVLG